MNHNMTISNNEAVGEFRALESPDDGYKIGEDAASLGEVLPKKTLITTKDGKKYEWVGFSCNSDGGDSVDLTDQSGNVVKATYPDGIHSIEHTES